MNRRSFLKRTGLLSGLAVLNPLRFLGLFKSEPVINHGISTMMDMKTGKTWEQQWEINLSYYTGKQWIPMED